MPDDPWLAPAADGPVVGEVRVPGSKSVTNRALVLGALADGRSVVRRPLRSRDTLLMADALRALGVAVVDAGEDWAVDGSRSLTADQPVDVGNAGTVLRFVPPVAALATGDVTFDGDPAARRRPVGPLLDALRTLGAVVDDEGRGALPFTVRGTGSVAGGEVTLDASSSSQLVSALLLAGPRFDQGVDVRHVGAPVPSAPHLEMTVEMLRARGARVDVEPGHRWLVQPGALDPLDETVEPDLSSAAPFLAAAVVTGGTVRVPDWPERTTQPGGRLPQLLEAFGATSSYAAGVLTVTGPGVPCGADVDLHEVGELTPVLVAVAALAGSPSRLRGIAHLRGHETDRLAALAKELGGLGGDVEETADGLVVRPRPLHGGRFSTYDDHRLAMAAAVLGLVVSGVLVENVATTAKTLPGFAEKWAALVTGEPH